MNNKVRALYEQLNKRRTIGDVFYDSLEFKIKKEQNKKRMIDKLKREQRWKKYPDEDWSYECPKSPNNLVGKKTQFKSHPIAVDRKTNIQSNGVSQINTNSLIEYTDKDVFGE